MCEHYKYMLQVKPEFDDKFKVTGKRSQMIYLCEVEDVKNGSYKLHYDSKRFNLLVKECGKCHICRYKKASVKSAQAQCEFKTTGKGAFVTLTFGFEQMSKYIKSNKRYSNMSDYMKRKYINYLQWTLEKREFQLFIKRLRDKLFREDLYKYSMLKGYYDNVFTKTGKLRQKPIKNDYYDYSDFKPRKIRFLHSGEYGEFKQRPHHHCIIFGENFGFDSHSVKYSYKLGRNVVVHHNNLLSDLWQFGEVCVDKVTYQSINYVARYVTKKVVNKNKDYEKSDVAGTVYNGRLPEYCTQSNRRGLGYEYYMKNHKKINSDLELYFKNNNGELKSVPLPRYFKNLMREHFISDYLYYMNISTTQQLEFSEKSPDELFTRMIKDRNKINYMCSRFGGTFEKFGLNINQSNYLNYELKKSIFCDFEEDKYFNENKKKKIYFSTYSDTDFVEKEKLRVLCYNNFEKYRRSLYTMAKNMYVKEKVKNPNKTGLVFDLACMNYKTKCMENPFLVGKLDEIAKKDIHIIDKWRNYRRLEYA